MKKFAIGLGISALLLMSGCAQRMGDFTVASTRNISNLETTTPDINNKVEGESCINYVLFIPFGNFHNRIQEAMDNAIENGQKKGIDGNLLVNVRIKHNHWNFIVYGKDCWIVTGNLVKVKK